MDNDQMRDALEAMQPKYKHQETKTVGHITTFVKRTHHSYPRFKSPSRREAIRVHEGWLYHVARVLRSHYDDLVIDLQVFAAAVRQHQEDGGVSDSTLLMMAWALVGKVRQLSQVSFELGQSTHAPGAERHHSLRVAKAPMNNNRAIESARCLINYRRGLPTTEEPLFKEYAEAWGLVGEYAAKAHDQIVEETMGIASFVRLQDTIDALAQMNAMIMKQVMQFSEDAPE